MSTTAPTYAAFILQYPEFASATIKTQVEAELALSTRLLDSGAWGDFYSDGIGLDAAHSLAARGVGVGGGGTGVQGATGLVSSVSGAGISVSFAVPTPEMKNKSDIWYSKTNYGQQFMLLRDRVIGLAVLSC